MGMVKHCHSQPGWCFVGVKFQPGYRWSKDHFELYTLSSSDSTASNGVIGG